jgi:ABC-type antimicrobial peptide transport system permease subunit
MYLAPGQDSRSDVILLVRATRETAAVVPALLASATEIDAGVPVRDVRPMRDRMGIALFSSRKAAGILGLFGVLGLLLSTIGTYGVIAHVVSRQTHEIGIRMALGARPAGVLRGILGSGARLVLTGTVTGILLAIVVAVVVRHLLYTPQPVDLVTFTVIPLVLIVVALSATAIPARRAARIDPVLALKAD